MSLYKDIHIGRLIKQRITECEIDILRCCHFFSCSENEILQMYASPNLHTDLVLKWSKLLSYDFFRLYSQHLILYSPSHTKRITIEKKTTSQLPKFRKSIYTMEIIEFVLELINSNQKTISEIIKEYNIPKTTLHKWIIKYNTKENENSRL